MHPLHFQVERKILRTKPSSDFSLANVDMTLVCQAKGETTHIPLLLSSQLVFRPQQSFLIPIPGTFLQAWSFCLRCHFDFSASSASGIFNSLLQTFLEPLTFLPPSLLPPEVSGVEPFLLTRLPPHQPAPCRLMPHWPIAPFCNSFLPFLHLQTSLLVCLLYFPSFLPAFLSLFCPPPSSFLYPLADHEGLVIGFLFYVILSTQAISSTLKVLIMTSV